MDFSSDLVIDAATYRGQVAFANDYRSPTDTAGGTDSSGAQRPSLSGSAPSSAAASPPPPPAPQHVETISGTTIVRHRSAAAAAPVHRYANIHAMPISVDGMPLVAVVTTLFIQPGEQLLMDYGPRYWDTRRSGASPPKIITAQGRQAPNSKL